MLRLGSVALESVSRSVNCPSISPRPDRERLRSIWGDVNVVLFDFDGTLTATPGEKAKRRFKIAELTERAPMLEPWLRRLREADVTLGMISKSSEDTLVAALTAAGLRALFNGPVLGGAVGLEGKAGFIEDLCAKGGGLAHIGPQALGHILLIDDDVSELLRARELGIQTYPAPATGGLQEDDFTDIFESLALDIPQIEGETEEDVHRVWSFGLLAGALGFPESPTQVHLDAEARPVLSDYYEVDTSGRSPLGRGSFGVCHNATFGATGMRCAMKIMRQDLVGRLYLRTFVEEDLYSFLLKMSREDPHPNVVRQLDYFMGKRLLWNTMELLEGPDLHSHLCATRAITDSFKRSAMSQLVAALAHIHRAGGVGIVHRDVKLENIRFRGVDATGELVLVDFGLCCAAGPSPPKGVVGTKLYMAPEIYSSEYTTKVDMWSAGVVLYIVLTGKVPWKEDLAEGLNPNQRARKCSRQ